MKKDITIRDYFAAKAMQATINLLNTNPITRDGEPITEVHVAQQAYAFADAMIEQSKEVEE